MNLDAPTAQKLALQIEAVGFDATAKACGVTGRELTAGLYAFGWTMPRAWHQADAKIAVECWLAGGASRDIAARLGRTTVAINTMMQKKRRARLIESRHKQRRLLKLVPYDKNADFSKPKSDDPGLRPTPPRERLAEKDAVWASALKGRRYEDHAHRSIGGTPMRGNGFNGSGCGTAAAMCVDRA